MQQVRPQKRHSPAADGRAGSDGAIQTGTTAARPAPGVAAAPVRRRWGAIQIGICVLFSVEGLWGLYLVGWPALSLCVLGAMYMAKVARRHGAPQGSGKR